MVFVLHLPGVSLVECRNNQPSSIGFELERFTRACVVEVRGIFCSLMGNLNFRVNLYPREDRAREPRSY